MLCVFCGYDLIFLDSDIYVIIINVHGADFNSFLALSR